MGLDEEEAEAADTGSRSLLSSDEGEHRRLPGKTAAHCWALLLARIFEYWPLVCPRCGDPMRLIAFILDPPQVERILAHIGEQAWWGRGSGRQWPAGRSSKAFDVGRRRKLW